MKKLSSYQLQVLTELLNDWQNAFNEKNEYWCNYRSGVYAGFIRCLIASGYETKEIQVTFQDALKKFSLV